MTFYAMLFSLLTSLTASLTGALMTMGAIVTLTTLAGLVLSTLARADHWIESCTRDGEYSDDDHNDALRTWYEDVRAWKMTRDAEHAAWAMLCEEAHNAEIGRALDTMKAEHEAREATLEEAREAGISAPETALIVDAHHINAKLADDLLFTQDMVVMAWDFHRGNVDAAKTWLACMAHFASPARGDTPRVHCTVPQARETRATALAC